MCGMRRRNQPVILESCTMSPVHGCQRSGKLGAEPSIYIKVSLIMIEYWTITVTVIDFNFTYFDYSIYRLYIYFLYVYIMYLA